MSIPDAQIFPHATAAAADTVAKHEAPQDLIFYAGWFCPYVQRSWIALEEKGVPYQYKEVNPYKKEAHFLAINPKGLVPAVEFKGKALYESLILCEFFEDAYPSTKSMYPADPVDRAVARIWLDHISKTFIPAHQRLLQIQDPVKQKEHLQETYEFQRKFAAAVKGPYFFGEEFGIVDIAIVPWVIRDWVIIEHRGYSRADVSPAWEAYAEKLEKRESVINTTSLREHTLEIYGRYLRDEAQSAAARAIREGRAIP